MQQIIECVPNFSDGRNPDTINQIKEEIEGVSNVKLLNVEPDWDYNRTVFTFVGKPEGVKDAAFKAIAKAAELIDMSKQKGEHPRIGATDVCPFVPISGVTMDACIALAMELGKDVGGKLGIPVYLYAEAARTAERKDLSIIRKGEYEGLKEKLRCEDWKPDYGPTVFNKTVERAGATVIGARNFLIAYNVNIDTKDVSAANKIAGIIRESGSKGIPGKLKCVKAMGVELRKYGITQVSMNLTNFNVTPIHIAYNAVKEQALLFGVKVTGSEIVGLVPKKALIDAGRFYLNDPIRLRRTGEEELINGAISNLGLSQITEFIPEKKIIEFLI
ncbi:MAG TPA: glutamate formimidoyltransferase [Candidatus Brocadiales bacterium]|nr:glutamate formimidoyltransferase [Candidatus Brocadiales bacterium]